MDALTPYLIHSAWVLGAFALGLFGIWLGNRTATKGKNNAVFGLIVGAVAMYILTTPYAVAALGFALVTFVPFYFSEKIVRLVSPHRVQRPPRPKPASTEPKPPTSNGPKHRLEDPKE